MTIEILALAGYALYLGLVFGYRTWLQVRRTGATGFHGVGGTVGSAEWLAGILFGGALIAGLAAPLLALADVIEPIDTVNTPLMHIVGVALLLAGLVATMAAQAAIGLSWRVGVDHSERTELITGGPFATVRNPIFSAMVPTSLGLVLMVPSPLAIAGLIALLVALELQVRVVEEPYLLTVHGERYEHYAARVGRFVPRLGRHRSNRFGLGAQRS